MPRTTWSFYSAGQLLFGRGATSQLGEQARRRGWRRVLLVTDPALVTAGHARRVTAALESAPVDVALFDAGEAEPRMEIAEQAIQTARRYQPDALVGLGGGSNMDVAKIAATVYVHGGSPRDYLGVDRVPGPIAPLACLPTTAGTGSEVSHAAVVTDASQHIKVSTLSNYLRPLLAVVDPELTYSCPPRVAADSGIDALTHAVEALTATDYDQLEVPPGELSAYDGRHPLGTSLAERAIELIGQHLEAAVAIPPNEPARDGMALAATLAGLAFSNCGVALVHALEYPLGGALHCSHGAGNGLLLPYVMRFNLPQRTHTLARIAQLLGCDTTALAEHAAAEAAIERVIQLRAAIGIPARLRDLGARREQIPEFAAKAFAIRRLLWVNPRRASQQDLVEILEEAY